MDIIEAVDKFRESERGPKVDSPSIVKCVHGMVAIARVKDGKASLHMMTEPDFIKMVSDAVVEVEFSDGEYSISSAMTDSWVDAEIY